MIPISKPYLTKVEAGAAYKTILSGWVTQGPKVKEFEENFAKYVEAKYAVAVSNCTTALHLALLVAGIKTGDEVICPSLSFIATANAIRYVNATTVFADVNKDTYNIDLNHATSLITPKTKAILIVHQLGLPADIAGFKNLARKYGIKIIEDAAGASGSMYKGRKIGSHSDLVCFSFHPRKVITTGEGGMITTSNEKYYERLIRLRQHGMTVNDRIRHLAKKLIQEEFSEVGFNYRMSDILATIGIQQLKKLDSLVKKRRRIAELYNSAFKKIDYLQTPFVSNDLYANYQTYMIYLKKNSRITRNDFINKLFKKGIASRTGLLSIHKQKAYLKNYSKIKLPVSESISKQSITLPMFAQMTDKEINSVIKNVTDLFS